MKLKTLKDLEQILMKYGNEQAIIHLLKEEAIEWIKRHQAMAMDTNLVEDWIKHFSAIQKKNGGRERKFS